MKKTLIVKTEVEIEVDETKFTPEFLEDYPKHFHSIYEIDEHLAYIVESFATGRISSANEFLEGYGNLKENFGVKLKKVDVWVDEDF